MNFPPSPSKPSSFEISFHSHSFLSLFLSLSLYASHIMQNHHRRSPSPTAQKPPRAPPLSVSIPSCPDPPTRSESNSNESLHSPLRSESPLRSDDPEETPPSPPPPSAKNVGGAPLPTAESYYSPLTSPHPVATPRCSASPDNSPTSLASHHHVISFNRREEAPPHTGVAYGDGGGGDRKRKVGFVAPLKNVDVVNKMALGVRVLEIVFCLISFSVMASDKTQGWSGDSFDRYTEYRFCLAVNVLGFVYSAFQAYDVGYHLYTGKHVVNHPFHFHFDFIVDQIFAYLLISASSAAATRVNDWESNWGKDEFTEKAGASVSMAFLAFIAFAISSLISGYNLCTRN